MVAACALTMLVPATANGAGETYVVLQCDPQNRESADARLNEPRGYGITRGCDDASADNALRIYSRLPAGNGSKGTISWAAPAGTGFVRVRSEAKLRRDAGHYSRIFMADSKGRETRRIATGDGTPGAFHEEIWDGGRQSQFVAILGCDRSGGCPQSGEAKTLVREVRMVLADYSDPTVAVDGSLVSGGWKRGLHPLTFQGDDQGSGARGLLISVNGSEVEREGGTCAGHLVGTDNARRLRPCSGDISGITEHSTGASPWRDGENTLNVCATDFAGNRTCATRTVRVDNSAPSLSFTTAQDQDDPELIHAVVADSHSGVAGGQIYYRREGESLWLPLETVLRSGELQARVDSTAVPAGTYEFRATATDAAGNVVETTRRQDGLTMRLAFPLKSGVDLSAALEPGGSKRMTIRYGKPSEVAGRLTEASGDPLPGSEVVVVENFGEGALIRERVTRVRTDSHGRWETRLPPGPSRTVTASYAGTQRYLPATAQGGRLAVRTKASLKTSKSKVPEGKRVTFKGRLGRLGARIPSGGKLLELQVREDGNSYQTVGEGFRSEPDGSYRIGYRFGRFYQYDVRFRFRIKVAREADWPYKAPVRSKQRTVTVLAG
jgi:hypothetical protein